MQLLVPRKRTNEVLQETYNGTSVGHFGLNGTFNNIRDRFYWKYVRGYGKLVQ